MRIAIPFSGLLALVLAAPASAIFQNGGTQQHNHSSVTAGGTTLAPKVLTIASGSTETVAGYLAVTGTATVGPSVYSTTAAYTSVVRGGCSTVVVTSFTAASTIYVTGLSSSAYQHVLTLNAKKTTQGTVKLTFNSDSGSNYNNQAYGMNNTVVTLSLGGTLAYFDLTCYSSGGGPFDGTRLFDKLAISAAPKLDNVALVEGHGHFNYQTGVGADTNCFAIGGSYSGAAPVTSLTISQTAGTLTGWLTIDACVPAVSAP